MAPDASFFEIAFLGFLSSVFTPWVRRKLFYYGPPEPEVPSDRFGPITTDVLEKRQSEELEYKDKWEKQIAHSNYQPLTTEEWQAAKAALPWFFGKSEPRSLPPPFLDLPRSEYRRQ